MPDMTPTELAYFAGFFDGEGCVAIYKAKQIEVYLDALDHMPNGRGERRPEGATEIIEGAALRLRALKRGAA